MSKRKKILLILGSIVLIVVVWASLPFLIPGFQSNKESMSAWFLITFFFLAPLSVIGAVVGIVAALSATAVKKSAQAVTALTGGKEKRKMSLGQVLITIILTITILLVLGWRFGL